KKKKKASMTGAAGSHTKNLCAGERSGPVDCCYHSRAFRFFSQTSRLFSRDPQVPVFRRQAGARCYPATTVSRASEDSGFTAGKHAVNVFVRRKRMRFRPITSFQHRPFKRSFKKRSNAYSRQQHTVVILAVPIPVSRV